MNGNGLRARIGPALDVDRAAALRWAVVINTEVLLALAYVVAVDAQLKTVEYLVYPFVWINVAAWAVLGTEPTPTDARHRRIALALATGYLLVLWYTGGMVRFDGAGTGFRISWFLPPGWSPAILYSGTGFTVSVIPFKAVGYLALAYLVYATILDAAGAALSGILGLLSCVSCTWPVLASVVTGIAGSGTAIAAAVYGRSYALSTVIFVVTVALLYWRPVAGDR